MMKTVVFMISLLSAAPFLRAQDAVAEDSGRATLLTPGALGETVYEAIAKNRYPKLRSVSALSLDAKEMETVGGDIIKAIDMPFFEQPHLVEEIHVGNFDYASIADAMVPEAHELRRARRKISRWLR